MFERASHAFSWGCNSCAHLTERKRETKKVKFIAQGTQQAGEEQGPEHRATEAEQQRKVLTPTVDNPLGLRACPVTCPLPSPRHSAPSQFLQAGGEMLRDYTV